MLLLSLSLLLLLLLLFARLSLLRYVAVRWMARKGGDVLSVTDIAAIYRVEILRTFGQTLKELSHGLHILKSLASIFQNRCL